MQYVKYSFLLLVAVLTMNSLQAANVGDSIRSKAIHRLGIEIQPSYVIPTHKFLKGKNWNREPIRFAISGHLKYAFHFKEGSKMNQLYPHAYQGIGVSYGTFINGPELGSPVGIYAFQGSRIKQFNKRLTLDYEWNFGVTFGWNEYNKIDNAYNHVIGTDIDAYMSLGMALNYQLSPHYQLTAGISMNHYSNANTHYPNQGVNLLKTKIGLIRTFGAGNEQASFKPSERPTLLIPRHLSYDLIIYGAFRVREINHDEVKYIPKHEFGVYGINFNPMYHFNNNLSAGASVDLQYDSSSNLENHVAEYDKDDIKFHSQPFHERLSAGLSIRGEWAMPIFAINGGIGYNFYSKSFDTKKFYQILAMKIFLNQRMFLHVGYQMNQFKDPNNLMLGMGYRFH